MMTLVYIIILILAGVLVNGIRVKVNQQEKDIQAMKANLQAITDYLKKGISPPAPAPTQAPTLDKTETGAQLLEKALAEDWTAAPGVASGQKSGPGPALEKQPSRFKDQKGKPGTMESWLGRNVLGIAASILVFVGLVFLGTLVYRQITETMKIVAMYAISGLTLSLGVFLNSRRRNSFTEILVGTGCGSFFISILLTHIYFNRISDIAAFSLLLVWMVLILFLARLLDSTLLSIVAHIGMIVSIGFAYGLSLSDGKLLLLLLYQAASITVILLGNTLCCKKTYHLGVGVSLFLTIVASLFMWNQFMANGYQAGAYPFTTTLPALSIASAFAVQFLGASFLSYLMSMTTTRLLSNAWRLILHILNKALWQVALVVSIWHVVYRLVAGRTADSALAMSPDTRLQAVFAAVMVSLAAMLVHAVLTLWLSRKKHFNGFLATYSVLFLSGVSAIMLIILWGAQLEVKMMMPRLTFLFVLSILLLLAKRFSRSPAYTIGANTILGLDLIFMLMDGYRNLTRTGSIALSFGYLLLVLAILWSQWFFQDTNGKANYSSWLRLASLLLIECSFISIFMTSPLINRTVILLLMLTALNILLYLFRYDRLTSSRSTLRVTMPSHTILRVTMLVNELVLLAVDAGFIAFATKNKTTTILYLLLAALAFGLAFVRIRNVLDGQDHFVSGIVTGIKLTVLVLATVHGHTSWFDQAYIFSVVSMLSALACIILGFAGRVKTLRLYGLVLTLVCVLKLVTYDVNDLNTPLRVVALIGGGVICFLISAIYNYTAKIIEQKST